jgi:hypothetical protein
MIKCQDGPGLPSPTMLVGVVPLISQTPGGALPFWNRKSASTSPLNLPLRLMHPGLTALVS